MMSRFHSARVLRQRIQSLQRAGKSFELQLGPDAGHSNMNNQRMMEFFITVTGRTLPAGAAYAY